LQSIVPDLATSIEISHRWYPRPADRVLLPCRLLDELECRQAGGELGHTQLYWYRDGIDAWEAAGLPTANAEPVPGIVTTARKPR
jgi:hypothetical protein